MTDFDEEVELEELGAVAEERGADRFPLLGAVAA
jgi:hypothetical protein